MTDAIATPASDAGQSPTTVQQFAAEALGTFILVFIGCGVFAFSSGDGGPFVTVAGVALAFGLTYAVLYAAFARISGGHFNPALTIGATLSGRMAWRSVGMHVGAQFAGAFVAGLSLLILALGNDEFETFDGGLGANGWGDAASGYAWWSAILLEIVLTAIFVLAFLAVTDSRNEQPNAPIVLGFALAAVHFAGAAATLASVNPARSFGPALFSGGDAMIQLPIFLISPLIGAALAGLLYPAVFKNGGKPVPGSGLPKRMPKPQGWSQQTYTGSSGGQGASPSGEQSGWTEQPIIQDGWQWDPKAQQWIPAQQSAEPPPPPGENSGDDQASPGPIS